ncbi:MAG: polyprenyl diphosphate synthase [Spirochaetes bacterium]|nr:polyprenyl diphosphate synthase [Spirochaetota bacterium]
MSELHTLIDPKKIPLHVAIIMDGNGRWAQKKNLPRIEGHRRGAEIIEPIVEAAANIGIKYLSLFAFSTENWSRPADEVKALWQLLEMFFKMKLALINEKGVKIIFSGTFRRLPPTAKNVIEEAIRQTKNNNRITINFCINYGGRQEIVDAVNLWIQKRKPTEALTERKLSSCLYQPRLPDVDLLIRTSGEYRISNFMLWRLAYAELVFMNVLWPDFREKHLYLALHEYQKRERRFGGL